MAASSLPAIPVRRSPDPRVKVVRPTSSTPELPSLLSTQLAQSPDHSLPETRETSPDIFSSPLKKRWHEESGSGYTVKTLIITARLFAQGIIETIELHNLTKADRELIDKETELEKKRIAKKKQREERVVHKREKRVEAAMEAKKKFKQKAWEFYNKKASIIQRSWRGHKARRYLRYLQEHKSLKALSAIMIQAKVRQLLAKRSVLRLRTALLYRIRKNRIEPFMKKQTVIRIRNGLPLFKGDLDEGDFDLEEVYAVFLQKIVRGFLGRRIANRLKRLREQSKLREAAALEIQRQYRGFMARKHFANIKYNRGALQFQQQMSRFERAMKSMEKKVDERKTKLKPNERKNNPRKSPVLSVRHREGSSSSLVPPSSGVNTGKPKSKQHF
uniref:Uncharacterized protein n=2 Tax=Palpitomonas bilix TaxID=652834 RepID=A0A7S3GFY2_9EUKA|mmetsp:Transcript_47663/g.123592  ORF Transcript_47663/g.123592 Transcript_47663/m.123592 type:complete len:387 (+) Transcript_47663:291-1451(+)|eukprot:CAMPEP_0113871034 /NCGR_PEP_ID=MMETSP0780_2-20120614/2415_1 /TAXON_ID=652834 /ORGANISM="Palpitomonas bilix" /LENGTH=386 /DNA_ID=CAMNT_0000856373 /DNA_START=284 /DNA_END=1444 /DNA_ORIENTATION=+ /assembly_acc=CAM_ASM_000599